MPRRIPEIEPWGALTDATTSQLCTTVPLDTLWVPADVRLTGDLLDFGSTGGVRPGAAAPGMLDRFLELRSSSDFLAFAKRYGPLRIAETEAGIIPAADRTVTMGSDKYTEPLAWWRRYQTEFRVLLSVAAALGAGGDVNAHLFKQLGDIGVHAPTPGFGLSGHRFRRRRQPAKLQNDQDWRDWVSDHLLPFTNPMFAAWDAYTIGEHRRSAARAITDRIAAHVRSCGLSPTLSFSGEEGPVTARLVFQDLTALSGIPGISVLGALCLQMFSAAATRNLALCAGCGALFLPTGRRRAVSRRSWCDNCRSAGEDVKRAKADLRARESLRLLGRNVRAKDRTGTRRPQR